MQIYMRNTYSIFVHSFWLTASKNLGISLMVGYFVFCSVTELFGEGGFWIPLWRGHWFPREPTRWLEGWNFSPSPGKGLEVESITAAAAKLLRSCPTLCDPIDGSPTGSPVPGILQARILEWVAISFSNALKWKVKEVAQLCPTLSDPMDCSLSGSSIHGIFQARVLEWGAIAFSVTYANWLDPHHPARCLL